MSVLSPAGVQYASAQNFFLEEVIVTARRRVESLQETPVAVTALDASALRDAGIRNLADLNPNPPFAACEGRINLTIVEIDVCPVDRSSEDLPRLPEETYLLAAQYTWNTSVGTFLPCIQASWKFDIEYCFDSASCESGRWLEDKQFDLNGRVTWISADKKWVGAIYGVNLTDEEHVVGGSALVESSGVGGHAFATPRTYGAELKYHF